MEVQKIKVATSKKRLDKYLGETLDKSRALIVKMIIAEYILVNNQPVKPSYNLKIDDEITILDDFVETVDIEAENMALNIIYEDEDIIVINKPSGLVVHPGSGNKSGTLVNGLMAYTENLSDIGGENRLGIVHRLDKDTSGLMLVAKNNKAHNILAEDFKNKAVKREYIALLCGRFPHESATIDAPIGRDKANRQKMTVTSDNSKKAITHLTVLKKYEDYTLVSLILETGRTHQIRVHMNYIGYPIYNDPVYNTKTTDAFGQYLHSASIDFEHPKTKKHFHFECLLPNEFQEFLKQLDKAYK